MVRDAAELSGLAEAMIARLRADGIDPTPAEIVRLNWLAWQVETPGHRMLLSRGIPVEVGGAVLWPLTLAADDWLKRVGFNLCKGEDVSALAYAMAHGRRSDGALVSDWHEARKAVREWSNGLRCTRAELVEAIAQIVAQREQEETSPLAQPDKDGGSPASLSAMLTAACGGPPELWEYGVSASYCLDMMRAIAAQNSADGRSAADDMRSEANRAFLWAVEQVRQAHGKGTA